MVVFLQTSNQVLQTLMKKYQKFCLVPKLQKCFIFTTSHQSARQVDPEAIRMLGARLRSGRKDEDIGESRVGKGISSPQPFSMFAAGASKRRRQETEETLADTEHLAISKKQTFCPPEKPLSAEEWEKLMGTFKGTKKFEKFEECMLEKMVTCNSPMDVAKSLLAAVAKRNGDIRYSILVKYLLLCVSQKQVEEIYDVYDIMKARFKNLEATAYSLLIRGLSSSQRWREALSLLEEVKKNTTPSKRNYRDCIRGALINQEINLACELFHEMLAMDLMPDLDTIQLFFDAGKSVTDAQFKMELIHIISYLRDSQVYPEEALMQSIKQWFESIPGENWKGNLTTIKNSGQCPSCNQYLERINLSPEEYSILKEKIMKDVIQGKDIFRKTTPQELEAFQAFVNKRPPFDIVIDGLNVARTHFKSNPSQTLLDVVDHLAQQNLRLLVLGRKHMLKNSNQWNRNNIVAMKKKADFFFTENISEDDPFLLYASLHSGNHCRFVTRDLLRDHKACFSDSLTQRLFFKWQRGHQMVLSSYSPRKKIKFAPTLCYDTIVQTTGNTWHIPYDDNLLERTSYEVPIKWLCLQQK